MNYLRVCYEQQRIYLNKYFSIFKNDFGNKAFNTLRRVLPDRVFDHL